MENEKKSNLPFLIIGLVVIAAIVGAFLLLRSPGGTQSGPPKTPAANNSSNKGIVTSNVPGASPAWTKGSPSAVVTIEEFADFQCPTCAVVHPRLNEIRAKYGERVRIVFRHYPLTQIHPHAFDAAVAAESAGIQGKFWDMQNLLFTNQKTWSVAPDPRKVFAEYAQKLGLDVQKFNDDMAGMITKNRIDADVQRGRSMAIQSTPSIYINGRLMSTMEDLEVSGMSQAIDAELQKAQGGQPQGANTSNSGANANTGNTAK